MITTVLGTLGALSGALSAYWWLKAAKVPPVYNTAVLSGPMPEEKARTDLQAALNAKAAIAAALAVGSQAAILALAAAHISN